MIKRSFIFVFLHLFFMQCGSIAFQRALISTMERKIALARMLVLDLLLLLDLTVYMQGTLEGTLEGP